MGNKTRKIYECRISFEFFFLINLPFLGGMTGLFTNQQLNNANMSNKQKFFFLLYIFFIFFFLTVTNKCTC